MKVTIQILANFIAIGAAVIMFFFVPWAIHFIDPSVLLPGWFPWLVAYISYEADMVKIAIGRHFLDWFGKNPKKDWI